MQRLWQDPPDAIARAAVPNSSPLHMRLGIYFAAPLAQRQRLRPPHLFRSPLGTHPRLELTDALMPIVLERLAVAGDDTDGGHFYIHGVMCETFSAWKQWFHQQLADGSLPCNYNAIIRDFAVRCMPSPYHAQVEDFFTLSTIATLAALLRGKELQNASALRCGACVSLDGFSGGNGNLAYGSQKIPDFSIQAMLDGVDYLTLVVECRFTQKLPSLADAANLQLTGTETQTQLVILVELQETLGKKNDTYP